MHTESRQMVEVESSETQKIIERYEKRSETLVDLITAEEACFDGFVQKEKESRFRLILKKYFTHPEEIKLLEIGAGSGRNLMIFNELGLVRANLYANELMPERIEMLRQSFPDINIYEGDANKLDNTLDGTFDIVLQSTVFTSILDSSFKQKLANKMWSLVKPGGMVLWYDFAFDNPRNKDVKGVKRAEVKELFKNSKNITFHKVTLAPPIGRRVKKLYPLFYVFPFLRTHLIAVIEK